MENHTLLRERIEYVLDTGQPHRPAYNEIKSFLYGLAALGVLCLLADATIFAWLYRHLP